jgi:hypothetical protein
VTGGGAGETFTATCEPAGQAREAIALWLTSAARPGRAVLRELTTPAAVQTGGRWIQAYGLDGSGAAVIPPATAQGLALARAMRALPAARVTAVLAARWPDWLRPAATDGQLAAALGIPLPKVAAATPSMIRAVRADSPPPTPPSPACR